MSYVRNNWNKLRVGRRANNRSDKTPPQNERDDVPLVRSRAKNRRMTCNYQGQALSVSIDQSICPVESGF